MNSAARNTSRKMKSPTAVTSGKEKYLPPEESSVAELVVSSQEVESLSTIELSSEIDTMDHNQLRKAYAQLHTLYAEAQGVIQQQQLLLHPA